MKTAAKLLLAILILSMGAGSVPAQAQGPTKTEEFAWALTAFNGQWYQGVFCPAEVPTIYVLADETHVLTGRLTLVYYWPIDREYKADWANLNEEIDGTLEIADLNGRVIQEVPRDHFLPTNPDRNLNYNTELYVGQAALDVYQKYEQDRDAHMAERAEYDRLYKEYLRALAANPNSPDIVAPEELPLFDQALAPPGRGFAFSLSAGTYRIALIDAQDRIILGSQATLISVAPRREGAGYTVIPESKWTITESSNESRDVVYYTAAGTTVYLQAARTREYNMREYTRTTQPQETTSSPNQWFWIQTEELQDVELQIWSGTQLVRQSPLGYFVVKQLPGSALGYTVVPFNPDEDDTPTFAGFDVVAGPQTPGYRVRLVTPDGEVVPTSERSLVRVVDELPVLVYVLVLAPLALALLLQQRRRALRARSLKTLAEAGA